MTGSHQPAAPRPLGAVRRRAGPLIAALLVAQIGCAEDPAGAGGDSGSEADLADSSGSGDAGLDGAGLDGAGLDGAADTRTDSSGADVDSADAGEVGQTGAFASCSPLPSATELCDNGIDDNCNGQVDERCGCFEGSTQSCYLGDPSDLEAEQTACAAGQQTCAFEFWGDCVGAIGPSDEACDDLIDNDCDGQIDEGCAAEPPVAVCPPDLEGPVLRQYELSGDYSDPNGISMALGFWTQLSAPPGHAPSIDDAGLDIAFFADVAGPYVFRLTVQNAEGASASCDTTVTAVTEDVLRVEMFWNPDLVEDETDRDSSDLDLFLQRNPTSTSHYYDDPDTCYWSNCATCTQSYDDAERETACRAFLAGEPPIDYPADAPWPEPTLSWEGGDISNDPRLDLDDVEGKGPENINVRLPDAGSYRLAVHYYDDEDDRGPALAYVRVLCSGEEIYASPGVRLETHGLSSNRRANDVWEVGDLTISYDNGEPNCQLTVFGDDECHRICRLSEADDGGCAPADCE